MTTRFNRRPVTERVGRSSNSRLGNRGNPFTYRRWRGMNRPGNTFEYGDDAGASNPFVPPSERSDAYGGGSTGSGAGRYPTPESVGALEVKAVDLNIPTNCEAHHTERYEITHAVVDGVKNPNPALVVRRGQSFDVTLILNRPMDKATEDFKLVFEIGEIPRESKKTRVPIVVSAEDKPREWGAKVVSTDKTTVTLRIFTPPNALVGKWRLFVETFHTDKGSTSPIVFRYARPMPIYVLFNAWCKDDLVYMADDTKREEYVLNDTGKIYRGSYKQIGSCPWNFGQFESFVLDCAMYLLDASGLTFKSRGNPIMVTRKLSAIVNSSDDDGVLTGNWSGDYSGGTSPTAWVGSVAILEQFWETKQPVEYGQCWVFSGVTTSVCRALGIPARSVTNFASAHDTDGSVTIDIHFDPEGEPLEYLNSDSIWNFHVWNDVWMARPDLPPGCGGWQAIDATPQETSDGVYCAGPASVAAIRNGLTTLPYDTMFLFSEVNADRMYWIVEEDGTYRKVKQDKLSVGKAICSKVADGKIPSGSLFSSRSRRDPDEDNIIREYKFKEGSEEERVAVLKACEGAVLDRNAYEHEEKDVDFELKDEESIKLGDPFDVIVCMKNRASEARNVSLTISSSVIYYTGVPVASVKTDKQHVTLKANESKDIKMHVAVDDYLDTLVEHCALKMSVMARVQETNQIYCDMDDFRLLRPDIAVSASKQDVVQGEEFTITMSFTNPLARGLTDCQFQIEGPGLVRPKRIPYKNVGANGRVECTVPLQPRLSGQTGERQIACSFDSRQLKDIKGFCNVTVKAGGY